MELGFFFLMPMRRELVLGVFHSAGRGFNKRVEDFRELVLDCV